MAAYFAATLALAGAAQAHFNLQSPTSIGFDDDLESTAPCGSFTPDFNNGTIQDWHVGGDFISTKLGHPTATWLYRATLDKTAAGGWVELYPIFQQNGLGVYCQPSVAGGADFVGKQGVLSVVANAPDGLLYQVSSRLEWSQYHGLTDRITVRHRQLRRRHCTSTIKQPVQQWLRRLSDLQGRQHPDCTPVIELELELDLELWHIEQQHVTDDERHGHGCEQHAVCIAQRERGAGFGGPQLLSAQQCCHRQLDVLHWSVAAVEGMGSM
jgi:hypothetical protein